MPDTPPPAQNEAATAADASTPNSQPTNGGHVNRLPDRIREKINQMLLDHVPYKQIIHALGDDAKHLKEIHLTNWKKYGFTKWLAHYDRKEALQTTRDEATDLNQDKPAAEIQGASRALASGQLYELLQSIHPRDFDASLTDKPELYLRLVTAIARLSEAESLCAHRRVQQALAELKLDQPGAFDRDKMYTGEQLKEILRHIKIL